MFQRILFGTMVVLIVSAFAKGAEPKDDLQSAVKKLADSASYSWTTTVDGGFAGRNIQGKTEKNGSASMSINYGDDVYDVIMKGDKAAAKGAFGWASAAELTRSAEEEGDGFGPERFLLRTVQNFKTPAAQAKEFCDKLDNVQVSGNVYSAKLSRETAEQLLLSFRRGGENNKGATTDVVDSEGSIKCWTSDGALSKMEVHVHGTLRFKGNNRNTDRTTTTEIKDVGSTKVAVPDDANAKL